MSPTHRQRIVVIGHGMVGHRFVQAAIERGLTETHDVVVLGEEPRPAYDRVALTSYFAADSADELIDPAARTVRLADGEVLAYDQLVLATGAAPFVPPVPGRDLDGCFVYRTIEDLDAIRAASEQATAGVVIGGGLLGLEAANALVQLGLETHVVEMAPRLMPVQLDDAGGATLVRHIEKLGVTVHTGVATEAITGEVSVDGLQFKDGAKVDALRPACASWTPIGTPCSCTAATTRPHASCWASSQSPVSSGLMRPSGTTAVASVRSSPKPPDARATRCARCQSVGTPSRAKHEYWHIGASQTRLRAVTPRRVTGSRRALTSAVQRPRPSGSSPPRPPRPPGPAGTAGRLRVR